jgi:outer membrane protein assembly factor BamB/Icc-related predicted phosphoesterase
MKKQFLLLALIILLVPAAAQVQSNTFRFALVTDTHVGSSGADEDLITTVRDIDRNDSIAFVIISGDVTEFGSDRELLMAKEILDSLNKPWYIIPGNHDTKWSESGANSFRKIFGHETFAFRYDGYLFLGTNSGPNMRMGPGQIPRENIVWLDSVLNSAENREMKIISINHYPLDNSLNNWYELTDRLKQRDTRLALCGHGHTNREMNFEGIPALMCLSNLRGSQKSGAYNIITISGDTLATASVRRSCISTIPAWASAKMMKHDFLSDTTHYPRPDYSMNLEYPEVKDVWRRQEKSDIGAGLTLWRDNLISTGTDGVIRNIKARNGKQIWQFATGAKIYSTPATEGKTVIIAATDGMIYALELKSGRMKWGFDAHQPEVASPVIHGDKVFITGSSGRAYALSLTDGSVTWTNNKIDGFVETIPVVYKGMLIFGTWNDHLYALDTETGKTIWDWQNGYTNRMLSPAACVPVAVNNRVFVVSPDRKMACLDALTGKLLWRSDLGGNTVRESMGVSQDSTLIFAKTMDGNLIGVRVNDNEGKVAWKASINTGYDIAPGVITEKEGVIFVPSDKGIVYAVSGNQGNLLWSHRISSCLLNCIVPGKDRSVFCSAMDGVITRLKF